MLQVIYSFTLAMFNFAFSAELGQTFLGFSALLFAVFFTVIGAIAGWQSARNE